MNQASNVALATLNGDTAILIGGPSMTRGGTMLSLRGAIIINQITAGDGPWLIGLANADLSLAELEAYIELNGPVHPDDTTVVEVSTRGRKIRFLTVLVPQGSGQVAGMYLPDVAMKGLRFSEEATGWNYFCYNLGPAMTTGAVFKIVTQAFVRWNRSG